MTPGEQYRFGPFQLDVAEHELRRDGEVVPLTAKTFDLLLILVRGAGRTLAKAELLESLWPGTTVEESNLSQTVFMLRNALAENGSGEDSGYILTAPRRGYKFIGSVVRQDPGNATPAPAERNRRDWLWRSVAAGAGALAAITVLVARSQPRAASELRFTPFSFEPGGQTSPVWSPEGKAVAFAARQKRHGPTSGVCALSGFARRDTDYTPCGWRRPNPVDLRWTDCVPLTEGAGPAVVHIAGGRRTGAVDGSGRCGSSRFQRRLHCCDRAQNR